jgi:inner membrane protein
MPSTIGHALAGATVAWTAEALSPPDAQSQSSRLAIACAVIAAAPDIDLLFGVHRTVTHSVAATVVVALAAAGVAMYARASLARVVLACAAAHASHLLLDWLAIDRFPPQGLQALWPFSREFYISGWDIFLQTERRRFFSASGIRTNTLAVARELAILAPVAWVAWLVRVKTLTRFATEMARRDHPA